MGAWADLPVSPERVRAAFRPARFVMGDAESAAFAAGVDPKAPEAKSLVETCLSSRLAQHVPAYGSAAALLDAVAAEPTLASSLQTALAYAMLSSEQYAGRSEERDVYTEDAKRFETKLAAACRAIADTAPFALGLSGRTGSATGGALPSVYT